MIVERFDIERLRLCVKLMISESVSQMILYWETSYVPARWKVISGRRVGRRLQTEPGVVR